MATKITMPQLGESITEGTISRWLKKEGEWVKRDEPLVEIITDKVTAEMPSPYAGVLTKVIAEEGAVVPVGEDMAEIEESGAVASAQPQQAAAQAAEIAGGRPAAQPQAAAGPAAERPSPPSFAAAAVQEANAVVEAAQARSSPLVRRLAQEHGVDLAQVQGTGIGGRITKEDILNFIDQQSARPAAPAAPAAQPTPTTPSPFQGEGRGEGRPPAAARVETKPPEPSAPAEFAPPARPAPAPAAPQPLVLAEGDTVIELTPIRRMIAEHMVRSKRTSPHATTMHEVDMTNVAKWRESVKDEFQRREGVPLSYVPFVIKATVEALKAYPILNSTWADDKIVLKKQINIGVAVGTDDSLVVPVIHDADQKSIAGLAKSMNDLVTRARANKLTLPDIQGGTFTVNNVGTFGSILSVPVINQPNAAILSVGAVVKRPVVIDDQIAIRSMMYLCMSFDHRIIDGFSAGRFLQRIRQWLEGFGPSVPLY